jgi:subtilisin-like proprotein convertase family protein
MWFSSAPCRPRTRTTPRPHDRLCRPALEPLEDRSVPAIFINQNTVNIPDQGAAELYPSPIVVSGQAGTVSKVTVTLHGFTHGFHDDVDVLLVAPDGTNAILMSDVGGPGQNNGLTLTLDDAAELPMPDAGLLSSGTYRPTNVGGGDVFPAPAPTPSGSSALAVFNGINPNGTWRLFVVDDAAGDTGSLIGGWSLTLQGVGLPTATTVQAVGPAVVGQPVRLLASVQVLGPGVPIGTVTFFDGGTVLGSAVLKGGVADLTVPGLGLGPHAITATYNGGPPFFSGTLLGSTSAALSLVVSDRLVAAPFQSNGVSKVRLREASTRKVRATLTPFRGFAGRLKLQWVDLNGDGWADLIVKAVINGKRRQKVYGGLTFAPPSARLA